VRRAAWAWARLIGGAGIVAALAWRLGTEAFLDGLRAIDGSTLLAASAIGVVTTVASAWRWCLVARGLGSPLPLARAVADYYRALFLNAALPGGVLGDVHRAVRHGRDAGDVGNGIRAVVLERSAGQLTLIVVAGVVLCTGPLSVVVPDHAGTAAGAGAALLAVGIVLAAVVARGRPGGWWDRAVRRTVVDVRQGLFAGGSWLAVTVSSVVALAGHVAMFLVAARAAGSSAPASRLVPLALLALLAMAVPLNVGGWGPREGVTAWAFGAAGLGATQGLTTAVVYGVLALIASLPGAGVLVVRRAARDASGGDAEAAAARSGTGGSTGVETIRQRVAQQRHVTQPAHLGEDRPVVLVPGKTAVADEAGRPRVTDEQGRYRQVQLVDEPRGEELGVHRAAALDHQPAHSPAVQVRQHGRQVDRLATVHHGRHLADALLRLGQRRTRAVDQLVTVTGDEELR
jgi:uncharacterized membrane protein YbhN (UPF0104 family)